MNTQIVSITYFGHSACFFNCKGESDFIIAVDPWLKGNPLCPPELYKQKVDLIVLTHGHADHASDTLRLATQNGCEVFATYELANLLVEDGLPENKVRYGNTGGTINFNGVEISLTRAYHSSSYHSQTQNRSVYAGEANGIVLSTSETTIYHAGDTDLFSDMKLITESYKPNISLLPIGDVFTMGPKNAAKAAKILESKIIFPIHYKTFPALTGTFSDFSEHCKECAVRGEVKELVVGEEFLLTDY
jgi:L-ascorbate metabolism protein UlaG (beta-lactamase superfamily)